MNLLGLGVGASDSEEELSVPASPCPLYCLLFCTDCFSGELSLSFERAFFCCLPGGGDREVEDDPLEEDADGDLLGGGLLRSLLGDMLLCRGDLRLGEGLLLRGDGLLGLLLRGDLLRGEGLRPYLLLGDLDLRLGGDFLLDLDLDLRFLLIGDLEWSLLCLSLLRRFLSFSFPLVSSLFTSLSPLSSLSLFSVASSDLTPFDSSPAGASGFGDLSPSSSFLSFEVGSGDLDFERDGRSLGDLDGLFPCFFGDFDLFLLLFGDFDLLLFLSPLSLPRASFISSSFFFRLA